MKTMKLIRAIRVWMKRNVDSIVLFTVIAAFVVMLLGIKALIGTTGACLVLGAILIAIIFKFKLI